MEVVTPTEENRVKVSPPVKKEFYLETLQNKLVAALNNKEKKVVKDAIEALKLYADYCCNLSLEDIKNSGIGKCVNKLRRHTNAELASLSLNMMKKTGV